MSSLGPSRSLVLPCAAIVLALMGGSSCRQQHREDPRVRLTIAGGLESGPHHALAHALARIYNERLDDVVVSAESRPDSMANVEAVETGDADLGFVQEDVAYFAARRGVNDDGRPFRNVRALAALDESAVQVVVRRDGPMRRVADLRGRRVAVSVVRFSLQVIQAAQGFDDRTKFEALGLADAVARVRAGQVDGAFIVSSYPVPAITQLNADIGVRLLPIERPVANRVRAQYPFFRPTIIPDGTYDGPEGDIPTIGVGSLIVCRAGLGDQLVYRLTRTFIESLSVLATVHVPAASIDTERARVTVIPLHPGAAWFYRERELFR